MVVFSDKVKLKTLVREKILPGEINMYKRLMSEKMYFFLNNKYASLSLYNPILITLFSRPNT